MRFSRLSLLKYGQFEDCDLHFPPGELDFHLVFGSNEAGKSTTLSAASDLLFGFPHNKAQDYRFDAALLRVGGRLENARSSLDVRRRRGTQNTLTDAANAPVPEAALQAILHNRSAEEFREKFSLDHTRLREGGRAMVSARGDVGQTLFAGGAGVITAQTLLRTLQAEADAIWASTRTKTSCRKAQTELAEAEARIKKLAVRPRDWKAARDLRDSHIAARQSLETERAIAQAQSESLNRKRALAVPVQQRAALMTELEALLPASFDAGQEAAYEEAARVIAAADLDARTAESAIAEATASRGALALDETVLDRADAIEALLTSVDAAMGAERDLPDAERELLDLQAGSDRLIRTLGLVSGPAEPVLAALPASPILADLQHRLTHHQNLAALLDAARDQLRLGCIARDEAQAAWRAQPAPVALQAAASALRHARTVEAVHARLPERCRTRAEAARAASAALARLAPWTGTADALAQLAPPAEEDRAAADTSLKTAARNIDDEARAVRRHTQEIERLTLEAREVAVSRRAVTASELAAIRGARQSAWAPLRAHIAGDLLAEPAAALGAYEQAVALADARADERFETAAASARLTELGVQTGLSRLALQQAEIRLAEERAHLERGQAAWIALLAGTGLPSMTPAACTQWRAGQADALQKAAALAQAEAAESEDMDQVATAHTELAAVLAGYGVEANETSFHIILDRVQRLVEAAEKSALQRAALQEKLRAAEQAVEADERRMSELGEAQARWSEAWATACAQAGLDMQPDSLQALLPLFERLRGELEAAISLRQRIARMRGYSTRFGAEALQLAAACGVVEPRLDPHAIAAELRARLIRARGDARAAGELDAALARKQDELRTARQRIDAARDVLAPLMAASGVPDQAGLAHAMRAAAQARDLRRQIHALEQTILASGDGFTPFGALVAEAQAADPATLRADAAGLAARIAELDARIGRAAQAMGEASQAFDALDAGGDAVLEAAADAEQARATLQAEAEAYLLKRAQVFMLTRAVDAYRRKQETPLLSRASSLFGRLTVGRYAALDIDREGREPRLMGVCADGRSQVPVEAMSDGTADQLFLALRLASLEQLLDAGVVLPFLADDLFINFDDRRAHAGFQVLGDIARRTQVLFFTHHDHLREIAANALGPHTVPVCELAHASSQALQNQPQLH